MKILPIDASDDDVLNAVREWVGLLCEERYEQAYAFLFHPKQVSGAWTPELIATVIRNHGSLHPRETGEIFKVTPLEQATGGPAPRHDVNRYEIDSPEGYVWFDLPLNGEWSDLTATLNLQVESGGLVFELESIEVM